MDITITSESPFEFSIEIDGKRHWLEQRGGEWLLDKRWVASKTIDWPEALARGLRLATGGQPSLRIRSAIKEHNS